MNTTLRPGVRVSLGPKFSDLVGTLTDVAGSMAAVRWDKNHRIMPYETRQLTVIDDAPWRPGVDVIVNDVLGEPEPGRIVVGPSEDFDVIGVRLDGSGSVIVVTAADLNMPHEARVRGQHYRVEVTAPDGRVWVLDRRYFDRGPADDAVVKIEMGGYGHDAGTTARVVTVTP